ncbi:MAG: hypothetical protein WDK96_01335 [Candidatus Paceibacterota bacterium]
MAKDGKPTGTKDGGDRYTVYNCPPVRTPITLTSPLFQRPSQV